MLFLETTKRMKNIIYFVPWIRRYWFDFHCSDKWSDFRRHFLCNQTSCCKSRLRSSFPFPDFSICRTPVSCRAPSIRRTARLSAENTLAAWDLTRSDFLRARLSKNFRYHCSDAQNRERNRYLCWSWLSWFSTSRRLECSKQSALESSCDREWFRCRFLEENCNWLVLWWNKDLFH